MQLVRVAFVPPEVNEPPVHGSQLAAWFALHRSSAPQASHPLWSVRRWVPARHGAHEAAPASEYVPASQAVALLVPSHLEPAGHKSQVEAPESSVLLMVPAGHELHCVCPSLNWYFPVGHVVQVLPS